MSGWNPPFGERLFDQRLDQLFNDQNCLSIVQHEVCLPRLLFGSRSRLTSG
jgi:hypothetical protein